MLAARERIIARRNERTELLIRYRAYLRNVYAEFAGNVDPITGARFAEISADGNKARGDLSIAVTFFEGTSFSIGIDPYGRLVHSANPTSVLADIGTIVSLEVAVDLARAQLTFDTSGTSSRRRTLELSEVLQIVTEAALAAVEAEIVEDVVPPGGDGISLVPLGVVPKRAAEAA